MIEMYSRQVTVNSNENIPLQNVAFIKGCSVTNSGTSSLSLNKPGIYKIDVNADLTSSTSTSGVVSIQLMRGSQAIGTEIGENVGDTTSAHALSLSGLVQVANCSCSIPTIVSVVNLGNAAKVDINVVVTKIA